MSAKDEASLRRRIDKLLDTLAKKDLPFVGGESNNNIEQRLKLLEKRMKVLGGALDLENELMDEMLAVAEQDAPGPDLSSVQSVKPEKKSAPLFDGKKKRTNNSDWIKLCRYVREANPDLNQKEVLQLASQIKKKKPNYQSLFM
jgi:hypothetical protein